MPKLNPVSVGEFIAQMDVARNSHLAKDEPIPEMTREHLYNIETCLKTPFQSLLGLEPYKGFVKKAAILFYLLIKNHPLANGNKRMAVLTLAYFCSKNGKLLTIRESEMYELALDTAMSDDKNLALRRIESVIRKNISSN
jgi:death-on-curing family protein